MMPKVLTSLMGLFLAVHVFLYRQSKGKLGRHVQGLPILLLTTTGRKTGKARTRPLGYFSHDGAYVIIGSNGGFHTQPAWIHNLRSHPGASIEVDGRRIGVTAEIAGQPARDQLWARLLSLAPNYANYARQTKREIPLVMLRPAA